MNTNHEAHNEKIQPSENTKNAKKDGLLLPLPATEEWGEDRGEGQSKSVEGAVKLIV